MFGEGEKQVFPRYFQDFQATKVCAEGVSAGSQVPACGLHPVGTSILPEFMSIIIPVGINGGEAECGNVGAAPKWGKQT